MSKLSQTSIDGHIRISDLVFSLTRQCNAFCDHCCNEDGPKRKGVIDLTNVREWIADFAELVPHCRSAGFTGGEAFLRYQEMLTAHRVLHEYDFRTSITTNGFWGRNPPKAIAWLNELKSLGLRSVAVSIDPSHTRWIPEAHSTRAAKIAVECGLDVAVSTNFDEPERSGRDYFESEWHNRIMWDDSHYILPAGRGISFPRTRPDNIPTNLFCPHVQLVIQPNGDVDPCCSVCLDDGVFVVGNLYQQSMRDVIIATLGDMYLKLITHRGFGELGDIVRRYHSNYELPEARHSVCFMCNALRKADNFWMVQDAMKQYAVEFILAGLRDYYEERETEHA